MLEKNIILQMQIRHQIFFTLTNFVVITWIIIWVKKDGSVEGEGAQGRREVKEKVDFEVMQVLRKLQAPQVKRLFIEARIVKFR